MRNTHRKTVILGLVLACVMFVASAGQATALDRDFGAHDDGGIVEFFEQIGDFLGDLVGDVVDFIAKSGSVPTADG